MAPSINRIYIFVKVFRAYLAKSPFKTTKNLNEGKLVDALKDDSGKLFYKKVYGQTSNKNKKEIIEQVIGIENEVDVKTVYAKNLQKQSIQSKTWSEHKSSNATLVQPPQEVVKRSEASSTKSYLPEPTFKSVHKEESNRSELLKIQSLFTLHPPSKGPNFTSEKDIRNSQVNNSKESDEILRSCQSVSEGKEKKQSQNTQIKAICKNNMNALRKEENLNYINETEMNSKSNVDNKPEQEYKYKNTSPVLQPFLNTEKKKNIKETTNRAMTTIVESHKNSSHNDYKHDTLEPYFRVRSFYKPLSNNFESHLKSQREKKKVNEETEVEQTEEYKPLSKSRYQYRVTVERRPASPQIIEESVIITPPPLPPFIPSNNVAATNVESNPMLAEKTTTEKEPHSVSEISKNAELHEANESTGLKEHGKNDEETSKIEEPSKIHHPNCPYHERFGFGDPYFHIRSYYRMRSQSRQEINYPVQSSTFIPNQTNELPESDLTPMQTTPKTKKRDPCDRLKKGYKDPPRRHYSTYFFHRTSPRPNILFAARRRSSSHIIQMNSPEGQRQRMISKKSASRVIFYDIGLF